MNSSKSIRLKRIFALSIVAFSFAALQTAHSQSFWIPPHVTTPHGVSAGADAPLPVEIDTSHTPVRPLIERFTSDRDILNRFYPVWFSPARSVRMQELYKEWLANLASVDFNGLDEEGRVDYILFKNYLQHQQRQGGIYAASYNEAKQFMPFADTIIGIAERQQELQYFHGEESGNILKYLNVSVDEARGKVDAMLKNKEAAPIRKTLVNRAAGMVDNLRDALKDWFNFYNGYDPSFSWWVAEQYKTTDGKLKDYSTYLREKVVGISADDNVTIIGDPVGREALLNELQYEMIPYTPEELIGIANKEYAWCEGEMKKASRELGYGDDWHKALEYVKTLHVEPGEQPQMIRDLAEEAVKFIDDHDLVTVPKLARDMWRMDMMSPERQLIAPFFLGGEVIQVSYPTNTMTLEQKMMSMRGNNVHFSRATVFHELIPGHHLQGFMNERYKGYRGLFSTPFFFEGNSLYWEFTLWDMGFPKSAENRVGMLFWRMHRCARIIFSLNFHLGKMTPQECVDLLVEKVGHERSTAEGEVRRSVQGGYGPLYQCAYMLGALQQRALRRELVDTRKMTNRQFHDALLHEGAIPIELLRAALINQPLTADFKSNWKFYQK